MKIKREQRVCQMYTLVTDINGSNKKYIAQCNQLAPFVVTINNKKFFLCEKHKNYGVEKKYSCEQKFLS